jgi:ribosomal protein S18 acetylase RimI-like enzyme/predicted DNA-binding protein YlxM (UPF0122 family)
MAEYSFSRIQEYIDKMQNKEDVSNFLLTHPKTKEESVRWNYKYWKTQPVTQIGSNASLPKLINNQILTEIKEQSKMLQPYEWKDFDLNNATDMDEILKFINKYNVSEENSKFQYVHTKDSIKSMLSHNQHKGYIFGVTTNSSETNANANTNIIGGIICYTVKRLQLFDLTKEVGTVKYIGVHPKLREKGINKMLMNEVVRRLKLLNIEIGSFKTDVYIPTPICKVEYYQRPINYKKLYETGYVKLDNVEELKTAIDDYSIHSTAKSRGVKLCDQPIDKIKQAYDILCDYQDKYNIYEKYTLEEFIHTFMNSKTISSYIIMSDDGTTVQDFYSYSKYTIRPIKLDPKNLNNTLRVAKIHTYTSTEITPLTIFKSAIISANNESCDLFISTDIMENLEILYDNFNKFVKGDTYIYYNFYNWECAELAPEQLCYQ